MKNAVLLIQTSSFANKKDPTLAYQYHLDNIFKIFRKKITSDSIVIERCSVSVRSSPTSFLHFGHMQLYSRQKYQLHHLVLPKKKLLYHIILIRPHPQVSHFLLHLVPRPERQLQLQHLAHFTPHELIHQVHYPAHLELKQ